MFLVDTGADICILNPNDGRRLGLDYASLSGWQTTSVTLGGLSASIVEPAVLSFRGKSRIYVYRIPVLISAPRPEIMHLPSILGPRRAAPVEHGVEPVPW